VVYVRFFPAMLTGISRSWLMAEHPCSVTRASRLPWHVPGRVPRR
jgi:hypothetical protein